MDAQRTRFVTGCAQKDIKAAQANELFDLIDKFAGYGFNKSHAAAYALLAYQTAWLKAHHPEDFFAASMCFDMHQTDKLGIFIDDMRRLNIQCLPPDINKSDAEYIVEETQTAGLAVRYALAGLKNVGEKAMEGLVNERDEGGAFASLNDFANRVDPSQVNRRSVENLAASGAFDCLVPNRGAVSAAVEMILATATSARDSRESGQGGLFGEGGNDIADIRLDTDAAWSMGENMAREKDAFGFYFAAHPVSQFAAVAASHGAKTHAELLTSGPIPEGVRRDATMAALIEGVRWRESRRGKRFVLIDLSDSSGQFSASCFEEGVAEQLATSAKETECLLLNVEMDMKAGEETPRFSIRSAKPLSSLASATRLKMEMDVTQPEALQALALLMEPLHGGKSEIIIRAPANDGRRAHIILGRKFQLDADLKAQVEAITGIANVQLAPLSASHLSLVR
jgi:DNA polymerase III subunit alpha